MANLSRIQNRFDQLSSLIQEVEASQEVADIERLKTALLIWKSENDAVLDREFPNFTQEVDELDRRWRMPMVEEVPELVITDYGRKVCRQNGIELDARWFKR